MKEGWQMETTHHHHWHSTQPFSIFLPHPSHPPQPASPWRTLHPKPFSHSRVSCSFSSKNDNNFPRWDSNAETFRPRNFNNGTPKPDDDEKQRRWRREQEFGNKRRWWSDDEAPEIDEGTSNGVWDDAISSFWILEVFKSYGWTLPIIIGSFLLATGPKAFLMALALPLGQSAVSLAFEKLWGRSESKPKRKYRTRRKPRGMNSARVEEEPEENQKKRTGRTGYQSWVAEEENNGSADSDNREAQSFGGWDDLERSRPTSRSSRTMDGSRSMPGASRLSRKERKSDMPFLLRLLIAVFPFLGTWTKML